MYRSMLLPLDGSHFGEHALQFAATLARRSGARLELVHVHNPQVDSVGWEGVTPFRYEGIDLAARQWDGEEVRCEEEYLTARAQTIARELNSTTTCKLLQGPVVSALENEIKTLNPDLVVMATHGRSGFSRAWLGSVADALVRNVHKPILLIRAESEDAPEMEVKTDHILIPLDGSQLAETIVQHAVQLGEGAAARYTLLQVVPPVWSAPEVMSEPDALTESTLAERIANAREYLAAVADLMSEASVNVKCDVVVGTASAATILDYARTYGADIIAMATHGRGGLKRLLLGSVADKVVRGARVPVLLYHP